MGRRRFWLFVVQPLLACAAAALALSDPGRAPAVTVLAALGLAFLSASQDILIDAWRIETFPEQLQGSALAAYVWGYRGAMLASTTGVIFLAHRVGWHTALLCVAVLLAAGVLVTMAAPAVQVAQTARRAGWRAEVEVAFLAPLRDFLARPQATWILAFVILFRLGKVLADDSATAFYRYRVGFTPEAIGAASGWSWAGTLAGVAVGGWLVLRLGTKRALLLTGLAQAASLGLYLMLLASGPSEAALLVKMLTENFAGACADMAFLTYVSSLCSVSYTATQYALLSSLAALAFHTFGGFGGHAAHALGYRLLYVTTILISLPALAILLRISRSFQERRPGSPTRAA